MPDFDFAMDYGTLHEARNDLYELANSISPTLKDSLFADLGSGSRNDAEAVFGNSDLTDGFRSLYRLASGPMRNAEDRLKKLGDTFGGVADSFFNTDAQISEGMGAMGSRMGLDEWRQKKKAWDYRNEHSDQCVADAEGNMPEFCSATDPGPPPVDYYVNADNGNVHTHLTLDDDYNVVTETTTVTHNDQTYTSTTTYSDNGKNYTTETVYADGSKSTSVVTVNDDGSATMTVTDNDGNTTEYRRSGPGKEWTEV